MKGFETKSNWGGTSRQRFGRSIELHSWTQLRHSEATSSLKVTVPYLIRFPPSRYPECATNEVMNTAHCIDCGFRKIEIHKKKKKDATLETRDERLRMR